LDKYKLLSDYGKNSCKLLFVISENFNIGLTEHHLSVS